MKLTAELLVSAYAQGVFPMDVDGKIRWLSPDPRAVIPLERFHVSKTLGQLCRQRKFDIRINTAFPEVMDRCADREEGTWISDEITRAFCTLHRLGLAHSVEAWREGRLAGGLYGVTLGGAFFGESMFFRVRDASKVALVALVDRMRMNGFTLLDVQFQTDHLQKFGVVEIPREEYLRRIAAAIKLECHFDDKRQRQV